MVFRIGSFASEPWSSLSPMDFTPARGDQLLLHFAASPPLPDDPSELLIADGNAWYLTIPEVASYLRLSRSRVYELLNEGLPSVTFGRSRRVPIDGLRRWLRERAA